MPRIPKHEPEVWMATRVVPVDINNAVMAPIAPACPLILQGFHPSTKKLLHTYGPFKPSELKEFAATHGITLNFNLY